MVVCRSVHSWFGAQVILFYGRKWSGDPMASQHQTEHWQVRDFVEEHPSRASSQVVDGGQAPMPMGSCRAWSSQILLCFWSLQRRHPSILLQSDVGHLVGLLGTSSCVWENIRPLQICIDLLKLCLDKGSKDRWRVVLSTVRFGGPVLSMIASVYCSGQLHRMLRAVRWRPYKVRCDTVDCAVEGMCNACRRWLRRETFVAWMSGAKVRSFCQDHGEEPLQRCQEFAIPLFCRTEKRWREVLGSPFSHPLRILHVEVQGKYAEFFRDHGFEAFRVGDVECGRIRYDGKWWDDVHLASLTVIFFNQLIL